MNSVQGPSFHILPNDRGRIVDISRNTREVKTSLGESCLLSTSRWLFEMRSWARGASELTCRSHPVLGNLDPLLARGAAQDTLV